MIYDILEQKLITEKGLIAGTSLFRLHMPAACTIGVMIRAPLQGIPINASIPSHYKGKMQVIVRHKEPDLGSRLADEVQKILTVKSRELYPATSDRGEVHLDVFDPETLPISFPRLNGNGFEWSQHFVCVFGMKSA